MIVVFAQILLDTALKGACLVALGAIAAAVAVRSASATRHLIWSAVVVAHLALPVFTVLAPGVEVPIFPPPPWLIAGRARDTALTLVASVWLVGVLVGLLRLVVGSWRVARLRHGSVGIVEDRWRMMAAHIAGDSVDLRYCERLSVPVVCGIVRPSILLPVDAANWIEVRWRLVLHHELAHVRRHDTASQLLAQVARVAFWFDPLLAIAVRAMRSEREHACDDLVLATGVAPWDYAHELIEVVRGAGRVPAMLAGLAMPDRTALGGRIRAILDPTRNRRALLRRDVVLTMLLALLVTIPLGALRPFRDALP